MLICIREPGSDDPDYFLEIEVYDSYTFPFVALFGTPFTDPFVDAGSPAVRDPYGAPRHVIAHRCAIVTVGRPPDAPGTDVDRRGPGNFESWPIP